MPNKVRIMSHLPALTSECRDVGACNTTFFRPAPDTEGAENGERIAVGTNTDVIGVRDAFYRTIPNPDEVFHNKPALVAARFSLAGNVQFDDGGQVGADVNGAVWKR
jgi:quinate dehydrogenase